MAVFFAAVVLALVNCLGSSRIAFAQDEQQADAAEAEPLSDEELEILVARIALYPDELVAVITASSLYPLQIVEAARYLEQVKKDSNIKPKATWDGSVISLLNYPEIVAMMSDDLDWTQALGDALTYQQKDVLVAIQQLREQALADGVIASDEKIIVVEEKDNIVIQPKESGTVYIPQYEPQMLYDPGYTAAPIAYYPEPYPSYYYPTAPYFAGIVTGVAWAAIVDWDDWGVWGGGWGNDIDIDCNNCFNNIKGKVNWNDVDWKNVDRDKISIDKDQFKKIDKDKVRNSIKTNDRNSIKQKSSELKKARAAKRPAGETKVKDVRKSTLKKQSGDLKAKKPASIKKPANVDRPAAKKKVDRPAAKKKVDRPVGKKKPAAKVDRRPQKVSGLGDINRGRKSKVHSSRGAKSMGGGSRGGGRPHSRPPSRGGGRRR
jgi:hypothetical protein